jgi:deoxyribonuclease IV
MILGLHIATAGNLMGAPARAKEMGADVIQFFASNPRGWRPTVYTADQGRDFQKACQEAGIKAAFIHMIYLVSYGTADETMRQKSIEAICHTLKMADLLGVSGVVTHMGSHKGLGLQQGLHRLAESLELALQANQNSDLILENSAGAGGNIGNSLEELATIIDEMGKPARLKVCLDTAHLLASGYEIRTADGLERLLEDFERLIGLEKLACMHLNDSKIDLGGKVDRHENIGDGYLGNETFKLLVNHPKLAEVPGMLEVPGLDDKGPDKANLDRLKQLVNA